MCSTPTSSASVTPCELAAAQPGAATIAVLEGLQAVDLDALSVDDRLYVVEAWDRAAAWVAARAHRAVAAFAGPGGLEPDGSPDLELCREDLAAALRLGRGTAQLRIDQARALTTVLPGTLGLLESGQVSAKHAAAVVEAATDLDAGQCAAVEAKVLAKAPDLTVGELRTRLRRAVAAADPQTFDERHTKAAAGRRVLLFPERDGMATLLATLPAAHAQTVYLALDTIARNTTAQTTDQDKSRETGDEEPPGIDARRADALLTLAQTALADPDLPRAHGRRTTVQVTIDLPTLLGLADHPGELAGYGPIPAPVARALAADATWQRLVTDPVTGHLLDYGTTTYRPPQALQDFLLARDQVCQFPGCRQPAWRAELDHITPYPQGPTSATNLTAICKRHHQAKTHHHRHLTRQPHDGALQWTSPTGRTHHVPATDHRPEAA